MGRLLLFRQSFPGCFVLFVLVCPISVRCETVIPHLISSDLRLSRDNSPYIAPGGITIPEDINVEVDPGVVIKIAKGETVDVYGNFVIQGEENNRITLTSQHVADNPRAYWGGLRFYNSSTSVSVTQLDIEYAGLMLDGNESVVASALYSEQSSLLQISDVYVYNSAGYGVLLTGVDGKAFVRNITVTESVMDAIVVNSLTEYALFESIYMEGNRNGLVVRRLELVSFDGVDFCALTCIRCQHQQSDFPLQFIWSKNPRTSLDCTKIFSTDSGKVLAFRPIRATNNIYVKIRDGSNTDSPILFEGKLATNQYSQPMPTIITSSTSISVAISSTYYYYEEYFEFEMLSGAEGSFGIVIENVTAQNHSGSAVLLEEIRMPVSITGLNALDNSNGLHIRASASLMSFKEFYLAQNRNNGLLLDQAEGVYTIHGGNIHNNSVAGLNLDYSQRCQDQDSVSKRYATSILLMNSNFSFNADAAFVASTTCRVDITVSKNNFKNDSKALSFDLKYSRSSDTSFLRILRNTFEFIQSKSVDVTGSSSVNMVLESNSFLENTDQCIRLTLGGGYSKPIYFYMTANWFENNESPMSLVYIQVPRYNNDMREYSILNNTFVGNTVTNTHRYLVLNLIHITAILYLETAFGAVVQQNVFANPHVTYQLVAGDKNNLIGHDARFNYWGSEDINAISKSIYALHQHFALAEVRFVPYLMQNTNGTYSISLDNREYSDFRHGSTIGGIVSGNEILTASNSFYLVERDITVLSESILTIEPGVTLFFESGHAILVYGKLLINGEPDNPVRLSALSGNSDNARLVNGPSQQEGILEVFYKNEWHVVCYGYLTTDTLRLLCAEAGAGDYETYSWRSDSSSNSSRLLSLDCINSYSSCAFGGETTHCAYGQYLYLTCAKIYWSGIHLAIDAKPSTIANVVLENYGATSKTAYSGISIDFLQHDIKYVTFTNNRFSSDVHGIYIYKCDAVQNIAISDLTINKTTGNGIVSKDSRFKVKRSHIRGFESYGYGIYIQQEMTNIPRLSTMDEMIIPVCSKARYILLENEVLFLRVADDSISYNTDCTTLLSTNDTRNVVLQVVSGTVTDCGPKTLTFIHGNDTDSLSESVRPDNNGMAWISMANVARLVMIRHFSWYRACLDIVIRAWSVEADASELFAPQFNLIDSNISGFDRGIYFYAVTLPIVVNGSYFEDISDHGMFFYQCIQETYISCSIFDNIGRSALTYQYYDGIVKLVNVTLAHQEIGIDIDHGRYDYENAFTLVIERSSFVSNKLGIRSTRYSYRYHRSYHGSILISLCESEFWFSDKIAHIDFNLANNRGNTIIRLCNNLISQSQSGIFVARSQAHHVLNWEITGNVFQNGGLGSILELVGSGNLTDNLFTNWTNNNNFLVKLEQFNYECDINVERNTLLENKGGFGLLYVKSDCKGINIESNYFTNNYDILENVVNLLMYEYNKTSESSNVIVENNTFWHNDPAQLCLPTTALQIAGYRDVFALENIFVNPNLTNEVLLLQSSLNRSVIFEMPYNYWGFSEPSSIVERIGNGVQRGSWIQLISPSPYYTSATKTIHRNVESLEFTTFIRNSVSIAGRMYSSMILQENQEYSVTSDVFIPAGISLTVLPGVILKLLPGVGIYVNGQLNLTGEHLQPIRIVPATAQANNLSCDLSLRLINTPPGDDKTGCLQTIEGGNWVGVCVGDWNIRNAHVACRQLGFRSARDYTSCYDRGRKYSYKLDCSGKEKKLSECSRSLLPTDCYYYSRGGVRISCGNYDQLNVLHFTSREYTSMMKNVLFDTISLIQISGKPPTIESVRMHHTEKGLVFVGSGIRHESDIVMTNVSINGASKNAISFIDVTSNVTFDGGLITNIEDDGILVVPFGNQYDDTIHDSDLLSAFRLCDAENVMFLQPGEDFHFYKMGASIHDKCKRVFVTDTGYSIELFIKVMTTSRNSVPVIDFYEGRNIDPAKRIGHFLANRNAQNFTGRSLRNTLTVHLLLEEYRIEYAVVRSIPQRVSYCTFEDGLCEWDNLDHMLSVEWGQWTLYDSANETSSLFKGLEYDVNFPNGKVGHYIYVGDESGVDCNYWNAARVSGREGVLQGPQLESVHDLCFVTFYHYRSIAYSSRGDTLNLYANDGNQLISLWSSTGNVVYGSWLWQRVSLARVARNRFSLLFYVRYVDGCRNSVGLDDIKFEQCTKEKQVSTIALKDIKIQGTSGHPIWIRNTDPEKHNVVWLERLSIRESIREDFSAPVIGLRLKSAYVLLRNIDFSNNNGRAIDVVFDSETTEREAEVRVAQNTIWNGKSEGAIFVYNKGVTEANVWVIGNDIRHNTAQDTDSVVQIVNVSLIMESNIIYNNTGRYILQIGSDRHSIGNDLPQNITENTFWLNVAQEHAATYTVFVNASSVHFVHNLMRNPANVFEFSPDSSIPNSAYLNCSENWWGTGIIHEAVSKIRSADNTIGLPDVIIMPIWPMPPVRFGVSSSCSIGWTRQHSRCMFYKGGAVVYNDAVNTCEKLGATLLGMNLIAENHDFVYSVTQYQDVDSVLKNALIWSKASILSEDNTEFNDSSIRSEGNDCTHYLPATQIFHNSYCNTLRPYICEKLSVVLCKNSCFQNGICSGATCICNRGWTSEDCSIYHCMDVGNCFGRGECVGPNQCKCKPGWYGRTCSASYCSRYSTCYECTKRTGCGWCDSTQMCIPGSGHGPDVPECEAWFYYKCVTVESNGECSDQIFSVDCDGWYCNSSISKTNKAMCQDCKDVLNCYRYSNVTCPVWDESICPNGVVRPNYNDSSRLDNIVFNENVIKIDPSDLLIYFCQVDLDSGTDNLNIYVMKPHKKFKPGDILSSPQAGGIFIKIRTVTPLEAGMVMVAAVPAAITDAIKQADFEDEDIPIELIEDVLTLDKEPPEYLIEDFFNDTLEIAENLTLHILPNFGVSKCIGHHYTDSSGNQESSQYIVIPASSDTEAYAVGDIIVSDYSQGFLEIVEHINTTTYGTFVFTELMQCSPSLSTVINTNQPYPDMTAYAGDNWPGMLFYNSSNSFNADIGEAVIGRSAQGVFGKIIDKYQSHGFVFIEFIAVDAVIDGNVVTTVNVSAMTRARRRKRDITIEGRDSITLSTSAGGLTASATVSASISLKMSLKVSIRCCFRAVVEKAGWSLTGGIDGRLDAKYRSSRSVSHSGPLGSISPKTIARFMIFLAPGKVFFDADATYTISASAEASITAWQKFGAKVTAYSSYSKSSGVKSPVARVTSSESSHVEARIEEAKVSATVSVTPRVNVQWPLAFSKKKKKKRSREEIAEEISQSIPDALKEEMDLGNDISGEFSELDEFTTLRVSFGLPMSFTATASGCDTSCKDAEELTLLEIYPRLDAFQVTFAALKWQYRVSLALDVGRPTSWCVPNVLPCCLCLNDNGEFVSGKLDPCTEICMCPCECEGGKQSVKEPEGECLCDFCPDDTLERRCEEPKCPCECPGEDKPREMEEDGSCPCECECPDGSKDVLDSEGNCPCECECKNCQKSTLGPEGCKCPDDVCPECEPGTEPRWVECSCECTEDPCGFNSACVSGRRGPDCDLPHCPGCEDCSGNGVCTTGSTTCDSSCRCNPQWEGACCEQRRPNRRSGDPHIETLDGHVFDYFGIGQFWDCLSQPNDFGLQARFFYFGQTSFTGAIAAKAGNSIVTLTTPNTANEGSFPSLRIDGDIFNVSEAWSKNVGNDSVKIDVNPNTAGNVDTGVVIVSLQFKSGSSLSFDVRYSPKISRQYINIQYIMTSEFMRKTSGICGFMDDDVTNDLMAPDGTVLNDTSAFVESWMITPIIRDGAGVAGTWSWSQSNFHPDDTVDISYTDPNFVPSYSLDSFSEQQVYRATMLCSAQGIFGDLLDGCIYDVVITDDDTFIKQEVLQIGCSNQCSGKGRCVNSLCQCASGWSGSDCSVGDCGQCHFGQCDSGFCQCDVGWEGVDCSVQATCFNVNNCTDIEHGSCLVTDRCLCNDGYIGDDCSVVPTCYNRNNCSEQGICVDYDTCKCAEGYTGPSCQDYSCEILDSCSRHGTCVDFNVCLCDQGWSGHNCGMPNCQGENFCSGFGTCVQPNTCQCNEGFQGSDCSLAILCPELDNCNDHGVCQTTTQNDTDTVIVICRCDFGYSGMNCSDLACDMVSDCNNHGQCVEPNLCKCDVGYTGLECSLFACESLSSCSGHGNCVGLEQCECDEGWSGASCDVVDCDGANQCSLQGYCVTPNQCQCYDGFQGKLCNETLGENIYAPVFNETEVHINIDENAPTGTFLFTAEAIDLDIGKNGDIRYSIDVPANDLNLISYLVIDNLVGDIALANQIARSSVPSGEVAFQVIASDQGIPARSASLKVNLTINDVNDHCPVFTQPLPDVEVYINSTLAVNSTILVFKAEDGDFGRNKEIEYHLTSADISSERYFRLDGGKLKVQSSPLLVRRHTLNIVATDKAETPCSSQTRAHAIVRPANIGQSILPIETNNPFTFNPETIDSLPLQTTTVSHGDESTESHRISTLGNEISVRSTLEVLTDNTVMPLTTQENVMALSTTEYSILTVVSTSQNVLPTGDKPTQDTVDMPATTQKNTVGFSTAQESSLITPTYADLTTTQRYVETHSTADDHIIASSSSSHMGTISFATTYNNFVDRLTTQQKEITSGTQGNPSVSTVNEESASTEYTTTIQSTTPENIGKPSTDETLASSLITTTYAETTAKPSTDKDRTTTATTKDHFVTSSYTHGGTTKDFSTHDDIHLLTTDNDNILQFSTSKDITADTTGGYEFTTNSNTAETMADQTPGNSVTQLVPIIILGITNIIAAYVIIVLAYQLHKANQLIKEMTRGDEPTRKRRRRRRRAQEAFFPDFF